MKLICDSDDGDLYKQILALLTVAYRPITLIELTSLVEMPKGVADNPIWLEELVKQCGSFLTLREDTVYLVHQSVKEFVLDNASNEILPSGAATVHYRIYSRSLELMSRELHRDMYKLCAPGYLIEQMQQPDANPLARIRYSCLYWIEHLAEWSSAKAEESECDLRNSGAIDQFLRKKYLYWLEALSLLKSVSSGVRSIIKLESILQVRSRPIVSF